MAEIEKKLTIIIPTFNSEKYIGTTLAHLKNQSFKKFKVLLIDDFSTDNSKKVANKFSRDLDLKFISKSSKAQKGAAASINYAFSKVKTRYWALIDSDAYLQKNWVKVMLKILEKQQIAGAPILALAEAGRIAYISGLEIESRYKLIPEGKLLKHLSTCNICGRKELIKLIKLNPSLSYAYDHELSFLLKRAGIFFYLTKKTFCHHVNKGGLVNYFIQQYKIAKYHLILSRKMKSQALEGDEISPSYLIAQPIALFLAAVFFPFNAFLSLGLLLVIFFLNYNFLSFVLKKSWANIPLALIMLIIKNLAWIIGAFAGVFKK